MRSARLFRTNEIVQAEDVYNGKISRDEGFIDLEEEFKVTYVKGVENKRRPYFRLYYSREDYKKLSEEQKTRYDILKEQRHYQESVWHRKWEDAVEHFAEIEKTIKNPETGKRKRADAFYEKEKICIEFQHSYIDRDFEERNSFYKELGIKTIWLYDLAKAEVVLDDFGNYRILEDNARGFFRIAEDPENLKNNLVFIQVKGGLIYQVSELHRVKADSDLKSTIRYFSLTNVNDKEQFIEKIIRNEFELEPDLFTIKELWKPEYYRMVIKNVDNGKTILINGDKNKPGEMFRDHESHVIRYQYVDWLGNRYIPKNDKLYFLSFEKENSRVWTLLRPYISAELKKTE